MSRIGIPELIIILFFLLLLIAGSFLVYKLIKNAVRNGKIEANEHFKKKKER